MSDAQLERTNVKIDANNHKEQFTASGEVLMFEGFLKVYLEGHDDDEEEEDNHAPAQQELGEMYKKAIQLNAENKLNSKNSWGLRLIENLDKFLEEDETVDNEKEKRVNFTKASCTWDASVKIYSYRVDDVHLSSYKVLANLNRNDDNKKNSKVSVDHENDGDGENKKPPPLERRSGGVTETIETNLG